MALACQRHSYLQQLTTKVLSCEPVTELVDGQKIDGYDIVLEDSVLFPEGGGQPDDRGKIDDVEVLKVSLKNSTAVHFSKTPLTVEKEVVVEVDWARRFDHMQQHSAQHLISAVAEREFNLKTTSWWLGETLCKIEMDAKSISTDTMQKLEELCNQYIREERKMYPVYYDSPEDPGLIGIKTRGLPDNISGPIRVMIIEGIDENLCCGTHVSNLAQLQAIKLVGTEKGKKGCTSLQFHSGQRVLNALQKSLDIERRINTLMKGSPSDYPDLIKKLQASFKTANKNSSNLLKELVVFEARELSDKLNDSNQRYLVHHRREGDIEYMNQLIQRLSCSEDVVKFVSVGDEKGLGSFLLQGPPEVITQLGPRVTELIDGKGSGKGDRFQGKANKLSQKHKIDQLILEYLHVERKCEEI